MGVGGEGGAVFDNKKEQDGGGGGGGAERVGEAGAVFGNKKEADSQPSLSSPAFLLRINWFKLSMKQDFLQMNMTLSQCNVEVAG